MPYTVQRWGNSLAIRIPQRLARSIGLHDRSPVDLRLDHRSIVIEPLPQSPTLEFLLAGLPVTLWSKWTPGRGDVVSVRDCLLRKAAGPGTVAGRLQRQDGARLSVSHRAGDQGPALWRRAASRVPRAGGGPCGSRHVCGRPVGRGAAALRGASRGGDSGAGEAHAAAWSAAGRMRRQRGVTATGTACATGSSGGGRVAAIWRAISGCHLRRAGASRWKRSAKSWSVSSTLRSMCTYGTP